MILVTGATGFIGSHLLEKLRARGEAVRCLVRPATDARRLPKGVESAAADLSSGQGLDRALDGVDAVIHVAGVTRALARADYFTANARATETLARALTGRAVRFVYVSSIAAVGPAEDGRPVDEATPPHPVSTYGKSKLQGEEIARALLPDAVIVRPPVVYGPRDTGVFQILKAVSRGLVLEIAGGDRWFSAIYAEDLAEGLCAVARQPRAAGKTYFLAHREPIAWRSFGATAAQIMGRNPRTFRVPVFAANSIAFLGEMGSLLSRNPAIISREKVAEACCRFWTCSPAQALADLGFEAPTPLAAGLAKTLVWYKEAGWLKY
ncbi:MAG TPA: NAD-dependent epimerase/dehydratase family protein [Bryobacteraceae bacterium]|jgi:nucleoside-diphosphate-sugar epimerase|nr:NAD-dependent epimerase/dehydratase family protein [Bryobacteraceae bacterium]